MKKIIVLIAAFVLIAAPAAASTRALQFGMMLNGLVDSNDSPLASGTVEFYEAGTTTPKNVWTDKAQTSPYTSYTLDSTGSVQLYGEGAYKVVVKNAAGTTIDTWDNLFIQAANYYIRTVSSDDDAETNDDFLLCSTNGGQVTITLPPAADAVAPLTVKRSGSNNVVIDGDGSETIDGAATYTISVDKRSVDLVSDGSNWQISGIPVAAIWDADGDTGIQVEESADEDTIRFDIGGTEQIYLEDGALKPTTDDDIDLGIGDKQFKDGYFDGTVYLDELNVDGADLTPELTLLNGLTSTSAELNILDGVTATEGEIDTAADGISSPPIGGDSTAGRVLRISDLQLGDVADDADLEATLTSRWNGDAIALTSDIAADATTGNYSLNAAGTILTIEASGLTGNAVAVLASTMYINSTGAAYTWHALVDSNDILIYFFNATSGANIDLRSALDAADEIYIEITYLTDQ